MRNEISEPKHWRSTAKRHLSDHPSAVKNRRIDGSSNLPADVVDAAFATESNDFESIRGSRRDTGMNRSNASSQPTEQTQPDLVSSLSSQLSMLEAQHNQISRLLAQAQSLQS